MTRTLLSLPLAVLLPTILGGCFLSGSGEQPEPPAASAGFKGAAPRQCKRLAVKVPDPGAKEGEDGFDIAGHYRAAWLAGNKRIGQVGACEDKQADLLEKGAR